MSDDVSEDVCPICAGYGEYISWKGDVYHCEPTTLEWFNSASFETPVERVVCSCQQNKQEVEKPAKEVLSNHDRFLVSDYIRLHMLSVSLQAWVYRIPELQDAKRIIDAAKKRIYAEVSQYIDGV